jgi:hypothetical protein
MSVCCLLAAVREELETGEISKVSRPKCHLRDEVWYDVAHRVRTLISLSAAQGERF